MAYLLKEKGSPATGGTALELPLSFHTRHGNILLFQRLAGNKNLKPSAKPYSRKIKSMIGSSKRLAMRR